MFFEKFSTFYDFHNGSYTIPGGTPAGNNIVQGYECVSTGTQAMPPSWMNNTDPNVDFDTKGRAYQVTLPFNPWWTNHLHPGRGHRDLLQRRPGPHLGHGQRRCLPGPGAQPVLQDLRRGRGQAVGGRQPHPW